MLQYMDSGLQGGSSMRTLTLQCITFTLCTGTPETNPQMLCTIIWRITFVERFSPLAPISQSYAGREVPQGTTP